jgi:3-oxoacyl-[acyl-carrier-protein] synthase-1
MPKNPPVYIHGHHISNALGNSSDEVFRAILNGTTGIQRVQDTNIYPEPFVASCFRSEPIPVQVSGFNPSDLEYRLIESIQNALKSGSVEPGSAETVFIFSSTKGNVHLLENEVSDRYKLWYTAECVKSYFGNPNKAVTVSNACISGVLALNLGADLIRSGRYRNAVVFGGDLLSKFVVSGFHSFKAVSAEPCRPFDKDRNGITLGEGVATILLSSGKPEKEQVIEHLGSGLSNDANHISGPSRDGLGLQKAIHRAMNEAAVRADNIDHLSAHGTATVYNDEMESLAFEACGLSDVPVTSLKGWFGHTLGAAGLIETALLICSMQQNIIPATAGYQTLGVSGKIKVNDYNRTENLHICLKTASGFGGCNAALILKKNQ